ncbi:hypothetical protein VFPBJ_10011 [Purpureocillium lilacinum]|uniref:Uncharacterized protein n=1 Tax=Purpureocillium lilacinum TaxID=33203 RepID=A0A179GA73_PURLI|nr:hypothetical protein VFPBJ_10011 [Purpureocillium lilacinum]
MGGHTSEARGLLPGPGTNRRHRQLQVLPYFAVQAAAARAGYHRRPSGCTVAVGTLPWPTAHVASWAAVLLGARPACRRCRACHLWNAQRRRRLPTVSTTHVRTNLANVRPSAPRRRRWAEHIGFGQAATAHAGLARARRVRCAASGVPSRLRVIASSHVCPAGKTLNGRTSTQNGPPSNALCSWSPSLVSMQNRCLSPLSFVESFPLARSLHAWHDTHKQPLFLTTFLRAQTLFARSQRTGQRRDKRLSAFRFRSRRESLGLPTDMGGGVTRRAFPSQPEPFGAHDTVAAGAGGDGTNRAGVVRRYRVPFSHGLDGTCKLDSIPSPSEPPARCARRSMPLRECAGRRRSPSPATGAVAIGIYLGYRVPAGQPGACDAPLQHDRPGNLCAGEQLQQRDGRSRRNR